jgi:hypothetical protein
LANWCKASLSAASDIFITIGGLSCARAAPNVIVPIKATAAAHAKALTPMPFIAPSPSPAAFLALLLAALAALPARTLEDRRRPDNGNLARCGEAT